MRSIISVTWSALIFEAPTRIFATLSASSSHMHGRHAVTIARLTMAGKLAEARARERAIGSWPGRSLPSLSGSCVPPDEGSTLCTLVMDVIRSWKDAIVKHARGSSWRGWLSRYP